jgi:hypothetical protein
MNARQDVSQMPVLAPCVLVWQASQFAVQRDLLAPRHTHNTPRCTHSQANKQIKKNAKTHEVAEGTKKTVFQPDMCSMHELQQDNFG